MFVKYTFEGNEMRPFFIAGIIVKLAIIAVFIFMVLIPFGGEFLTLLEESLNTSVWDLSELLKPIGMIILYFFILTVIESIIAFLIILPLARRFFNNL